MSAAYASLPLNDPRRCSYSVTWDFSAKRWFGFCDQRAADLSAFTAGGHGDNARRSARGGSIRATKHRCGGQEGDVKAQRIGETIRIEPNGPQGMKIIFSQKTETGLQRHFFLNLEFTELTVDQPKHEGLLRLIAAAVTGGSDAVFELMPECLGDQPDLSDDEGATR